MNSNKIRETFLEFFRSKEHEIVPSAPMVVKNDPTLMFTNAGMNQFKDLFLGNSPIKYKRIADTQKCLRVSGKHNDLEEVGHDTYHHTMFEMLGNWSFGDYFKKEAIDWAWELLVDVFGMDKSRIYATVFEGYEADGVEFDSEAYALWEKYLPKEHIIYGNKKDNFWEMGETGPCGPCSEIHVDLRDDSEREKVDGASLVNKDNPLVIEIWNLVFMQFNRKANGTLERLPACHVDTGMGFERLCMVLQGKKSNYDTDVFTPLIRKISLLSDVEYGKDVKCDIAMRVIADHIRTIAFSIADGQMPSNVKAGYVIRRILRRAVRYGYTYLNFREPFLCKLVARLIENMGEQFPELTASQTLITKVIEEEELSFLRTLSTGINLLDGVIAKTREASKNIISGKDAFVLYDTYGFPIDLTELIAREQQMSVDIVEFEKELEAQKNRSRNAAVVETGDWVEVNPINESVFVGYDALTTDVKIARYRQVTSKGKTQFQLVFDQTPFYGNSGGQVGDKGYIESAGEKISIVDTQKENGLTVHIAASIPTDVTADFVAVVNEELRTNSSNNHTATHLLHKALREVLGTHVEQKGSLVQPSGLRFDFSHFQKVSYEELQKVEKLVNAEIRKNSQLIENRACPIEKARESGAMMLFGEKYGEEVRTVRFGDWTELCGGCHSAATGQIGYFKIKSEGAISAGVRRIEAVTGQEAVEIIQDGQNVIEELKKMFNTPSIVAEIKKLRDANIDLTHKIDEFAKARRVAIKEEIKEALEYVDGVNWYVGNLEVAVDGLKEIAQMLKTESAPIVFVVGTTFGSKPSLVVMVSDDLANQKGINASTVVRQAAKLIQGGGGGQPTLATAGGKDSEKLGEAIDLAVSLIKEKI
ncbi:MAG: alanine--tRNA ligase [Rikenellaceae bacterium]